MTGRISLDIQQQIEKGVDVLRRGGLVAYPTDTVYGLGAGISLPDAIDRIYQIKRRSRHMPLPVLLADRSQLDTLAGQIPSVARLLIDSFWPGALTLVLAKSDSVPDTVTAGGDTIAVRIPAHPVPVALIKGLGVPIIGTSANLSGQPSPLTANEVYSQLGKKVDFIIDSGRCPGGKESTVVDITGNKPLILREGAISKEELERVCGHILSR